MDAAPALLDIGIDIGIDNDNGVDLELEIELEIAVAVLCCFEWRIKGSASDANTPTMRRTTMLRARTVHLSTRGRKMFLGRWECEYCVR